MTDCRAAVRQLKCLQSPSQITLNGFQDKLAKPVMPTVLTGKCAIDLNEKQEDPFGVFIIKLPWRLCLMMLRKSQMYHVSLENKEPVIYTFLCSS